MDELAERARISNIQSKPIPAGAFKRVVSRSTHAEEHLFAYVKAFTYSECLPHLMRTSHRRQEPGSRSRPKRNAVVRRRRGSKCGRIQVWRSICKIRLRGSAAQSQRNARIHVGPDVGSEAGRNAKAGIAHLDGTPRPVVVNTGELPTAQESVGPAEVETPPLAKRSLINSSKFEFVRRAEFSDGPVQPSIEVILNRRVIRPRPVGIYIADGFREGIGRQEP